MISSIGARPLMSARALLRELGSLPKWSLAAAALFQLAALAMAFPRGGVGAMLVALLGTAVVLTIASSVASPADRRWVLMWTLLAITARQALVGAIDIALLVRDLPWYAPDERTYVQHAHSVWQHWNDPSAPFAPDSYTASLYVHEMARLYQVFGENLMVVKLVNTAMACVAALFGYRVMRNLGMPGGKWALVLILAWPSVAFWAALTLKDAFVIFFLIGSLWAASEFIRGRNPLWLALAFLGLMPLEHVRLYMLVTGALALLAVPFALKRWRERLASALALLVSVYAMFVIVQPFSDLGPNVLYIPIFLRGAVAQGARTSFVEPRPVIQGEPGQRFQIEVATGATPDPNSSPRVISVEPGTAIIVASAPPIGAATSVPSPALSGASPTPRAPGATPTPAVVRPGDIVVIATPKPTVAPASSAPASGAPSPSPSPSPLPTATVAPQVVTLVADAKNTVGLSTDVDPDQSSLQGSLSTNIRFLPVGITFTLFAPFPWTAQTLEQLATIPEMIVWYACLGLALLAFLTLLRRRDFRYAHGVAAIIGLVIVLSLISANTGTLIRSRAMLIPYVLILSGVGIDWMLRRYPRLAARLRMRPDPRPVATDQSLS
jgi:hypothetical protein